MGLVSVSLASPPTSVSAVARTMKRGATKARNMPTHHGNTENGNSDKIKLIAVRKREGCPNTSCAERTAF